LLAASMRGSGDPRDSRPGGQRYLFADRLLADWKRISPLGQAGSVGIQ